jgi:hypothetical protein
MKLTRHLVAAKQRFEYAIKAFKCERKTSSTLIYIYAIKEGTERDLIYQPFASGVTTATLPNVSLPVPFNDGLDH